MRLVVSRPLIISDSTGVEITVTTPTNPDLVVINPSVSDSTLTPGQSFTIYATVENQGNGSSSSTTLRYYRSTNSIISTGDTLLGTDAVSALSRRTALRLKISPPQRRIPTGPTG